MSIDNCIDSSFNDFLCTAKYQYLSFLYLSIIIKTFYISGYRSSESSSVKNCLTDEALLYDAAEFNQNIGTHPGQLTHPNEQCKATVGPRSYYGWVSPMYLICLFLLSKKENNIDEKVWWTVLQGGALKTFEDICTSMACNTGEGASLFVFGIAYSGTSCGDKKVILGSLTFYFHPFSTNVIELFYVSNYDDQTTFMNQWTTEMLSGCTFVFQWCKEGQCVYDPEAPAKKGESLTNIFVTVSRKNPFFSSRW